MKLHEFQAKGLFRQYGIPVPEGCLIESPEDVAERVEQIDGPPWILKAQIHAGGRGKVGGVIKASSVEEIREAAETLLGKRLATGQSGPEGVPVDRLLIEEAVDIEHEFYLALLVDRSHESPCFIFSMAGGMEIEEIAAKNPELILRETIDPAVGWSGYHARNLLYGLEPPLQAKTIKALGAVMSGMYRLFNDKDCSLVEINPLVVTRDGDAVALDAKISIDDNSLFRQKELLELDDERQKDDLEAMAARHSLNYIHLDGNIGAMVNGAGLAMATMDVIKIAGAEPANFLDVGGGASEEMITRGLEIILMDERVRAILINIFGGILRCDVLARGVLEAAKKTNIEVPLIVRLEGTNMEKGREILEKSELEFLVARDLADAARLVAQQVS